MRYSPGIRPTGFVRLNDLELWTGLFKFLTGITLTVIWVGIYDGWYRWIEIGRWKASIVTSIILRILHCPNVTIWNDLTLWDVIVTLWRWRFYVIDWFWLSEKRKGGGATEKRVGGGVKQCTVRVVACKEDRKGFALNIQALQLCINSFHYATKYCSSILHSASCIWMNSLY